MATQSPKPWFKSTTVLFNLAAIVVIVIQYALNTQIIPVGYQELALAVLNLVNRFRTSQPVSL